MHLFNEGVINNYLNNYLNVAAKESTNDEFICELEAYLDARYLRKSKPGRIIIVFGTGRNGSTSISQALRALPNSLITHERPPNLAWKEPGKALSLHIKIMSLMCNYFDFIGDVSHWWLPHLKELASHFPDFKLIFLYRDKQETIDSFYRLKSRFSVPFNHWDGRRVHEWKKDSWDICYPSVTLSRKMQNLGRDQYLRACIEAYVNEYQQQAELALKVFGGLSVTLESLFTDETSAALQTFLGVRFSWQKVHLNQKNTEASLNQVLF